MARRSKTHCTVEITADDQFEVIETYYDAGEASEALDKLRAGEDGLTRWNFAMMPYSQKQALLPPGAKLRRQEKVEPPARSDKPKNSRKKKAK